MYRTLSALAALAMTAGTLAIAAPAHAAPAEEAFSISLEGLDASNPGDATRIDRRIRSAAQSHCGSNMVQPNWRRAQALACEQAVAAEARSAVQLAAANRSTPFRLALRVR